VDIPRDDFSALSDLVVLVLDLACAHVDFDFVDFAEFVVDRRLLLALFGPVAPHTGPYDDICHSTFSYIDGIILQLLSNVNLPFQPVLIMIEFGEPVLDQ